MTNQLTALRAASVALVILAGSCAAPFNDGDGLVNDAAVNHPIAVEPHYSAIKVSFSAPQAGLMPDDAARLDAFVADYLVRGAGSISVSAPAGQGSTATLDYFGERLFQMGVPRARILVGTHDGDQHVEIGYIAYGARADECGDWSENLGDTASNRSAANFGCAVQKNMAAQLADPRDYIELRGTDPVDATRRATVLDSYEKGKVTASEKSQAQSGAVSDVDK